MRRLDTLCVVLALATHLSEALSIPQRRGVPFTTASVLAAPRHDRSPVASAPPSHPHGHTNERRGTRLGLWRRLGLRTLSAGPPSSHADRRGGSDGGGDGGEDGEAGGTPTNDFTFDIDVDFSDSVESDGSGGRGDSDGGSDDDGGDSTAIAGQGEGGGTTDGRDDADGSTSGGDDRDGDGSTAIAGEGDGGTTDDGDGTFAAGSDHAGDASSLGPGSDGGTTNGGDDDPIAGGDDDGESGTTTANDGATTDIGSGTRGNTEPNSDAILGEGGLFESAIAAGELNSAETMLLELRAKVCGDAGVAHRP